MPEYWNENELWRALLSVIQSGLLPDYPDLSVKLVYQPTTQSDGLAPRLLLYRVGQRRYGGQGVKQSRVCRAGSAEAPQGNEPEIMETAIWRKEDDFQANALVDRNQEDAGYTAKDVLESLAAWLQGEA